MSKFKSELAEIDVEELHRAAASALRTTLSADVKAFLSDHPYPSKSEKANIRATYPQLSPFQKGDDHPYALGWVLTRERKEKLDEIGRQTSDQELDPDGEMSFGLDSIIELRERGNIKNLLPFYAHPSADMTTADTPWADQVAYTEQERLECEGGRVPTLVIAYTSPAYVYRQRISQASYEWLEQLLDQACCSGGSRQGGLGGLSQYLGYAANAWRGGTALIAQPPSPSISISTCTHTHEFVGFMPEIFIITVNCGKTVVNPN
ncbi:hypothetical protein K466DRAFT_662873 [Polyporus arcularius HHB13444]|uniref:Uncharacterized protein n=1 Tax=Polyporus arcularius HHB13444 TaxID=1314778 RepID=A0A5C3PHD8_9APHY|nr:hypothetical protein K466DRAFT_662873 [Polyporus arcularius HHB13444]